jgi:putative acetyltransferase
VGGLKAIGPDYGEFKSMHTLQEARGQGAGKHLLRALLKHAQTMGFTKISLKIGSESPFEPARQMYQAHIFSECPPLANYVKEPLSVFMTRTL